MTDRTEAARLADRIMLEGFYRLGVELGGNDMIAAVNLTCAALAAAGYAVTSAAARPAVEVPEPVYKAVERILDDASAWIARPNRKVTERVALAATIAAHTIIETSSADARPAVGETWETPEGAVMVVPVIASDDQESAMLDTGLVEEGVPGKSPSECAQKVYRVALAAVAKETTHD